MSVEVNGFVQAVRLLADWFPIVGLGAGVAGLVIGALSARAKEARARRSEPVSPNYRLPKVGEEPSGGSESPADIRREPPPDTQYSIDGGGPPPPSKRPPPRKPPQPRREPSSPQHWFQLAAGVLILLAALYIILSQKYGDAEQKWAYGALGLAAGFAFNAARK